MENILIKFGYVEETHSYEIKNYDTTLENIKQYLENHSLKNVVVLNEDDKKAVKKARTELRKILTDVQNVRKTSNKLILGKFNEQCKEIEKILGDAEQNLKVKINDFENKENVKKYRLIATSNDISILEKALIELEKMGIKGEIQ